MLEHALKYQSYGWHVFPVHTIRDGKCSCGHADCENPGKHPMTRNGLTDASNDIEQIKAWWAKWPDANIGVVTGALSGIVVIDIDNHLEARGFLEKNEFPNTAMQRTGRAGGNGRHIIYKHPGVPIKSWSKKIPGIDSRGEGGYFIAPPSLHASGNRYEWMTDPELVEIADCPQFWIDVCQKKEQAKMTAGDDIWPEGGRNNRMTSEVGKWRRMDVDFDFALANAQRINLQKCSPPMSEEEVERIVKSVYRYDVKSAEDIELERIGGEILSNWEATEQAKIASMLKSHPRTAKAGPMPDTVMPPVGNLIRDIADEILESAMFPQPNLAIGAAVTFIGVCMGQKYRTETDLRSNLYIVGLAESGSGKDHARKCIKKLASLTNAKDRIGGETVASAQGLISALVEHPSRLYLFDEFGLMLASMNQQGGPKHELMSTLMTLYSSASSIMTGAEYADRKLRPQKTLYYPCCCLYPVSTQETFYKALSGGDSSSGAIARMMVIHDGLDRGKCNRNIKPYEPSQSVIDRINAIVAHSGGMFADIEDGSHPPAQELITVEMLTDIKEACFDLIDHLSEKMDGPATRSVYSRVAENAAKLAMIYAVSSDHEAPFIDAEAWLWGRDLAFWCANFIIEQFNTHVSDNQFQHDCKRLLERIRKEGEFGLSRPKMCKNMDFSAKYRDELLQTVIESGNAVITKDGKIVHIDYAIE